ncbi:MAG: tetratricopeptide repeat protein [Spirochaetia bacterium]|nr:tetratricopeptide repeat protein [Spirochaetia bacterium]
MFQNEKQITRTVLFFILFSFSAGSERISAREIEPAEELVGPNEILSGQNNSKGTFFRSGNDFILCKGRNFQDPPPEAPPFIENKSAGTWNNEAVAELLESEGKKEIILKIEVRFRTAVEKDPQFLAFVYNYGRILQILNRHEEAFEYFKRAAAMLPELSASNTNAGISLSRTDQKYSSVYYLKKALKINPLDTKAELALAYFYLNERSYLKAEYYFQHLLERHPGLPDAVAGLAGIYFKKSDLKNARKYYDLIEVEDELGHPLPFSPLIFYERAAFYKYIGEHETSIEDLKFLLRYKKDLFLYGMDGEFLEKRIQREENRLSGKNSDSKEARVPDGL